MERGTHKSEGVVYKARTSDRPHSPIFLSDYTHLKVSETRIVIAVDPPDSASEDLDLPERVRVVKLANSVTYDRLPTSSAKF